MTRVRERDVSELEVYDQVPQGGYLAFWTSTAPLASISATPYCLTDLLCTLPRHHLMIHLTLATIITYQRGGEGHAPLLVSLVTDESMGHQFPLYLVTPLSSQDEDDHHILSTI